MEGAQPHQVGAGLLELHMPADDVDDVDAGEEVVDLREGLVLPGFVDTHVHFPQLRVIGALGMPLLDWLDRAALPEELRMADDDQAAAVAGGFLRGLREAGETVVCVLPGHEHEVDEFACDRELVRDGGRWTVRPV